MPDRLIEFGAIQFDKDKENQRGRPRDFYGFDEITEFTEQIYRFTTAWNRSVNPDQRCRIICTGNPPTSAEGEWVIRYWGPWLDETHSHYPVRQGELCWFVRIDEKDIVVSDNSPYVHTRPNGEKEILHPRSRTFIAAKLDDNPHLADSGYRAMLQSMPEPLRSQMLYGDFTIGVIDDVWQVIPTAWVRAAQARWRPQPPPGVSLSCIGVDVSLGGADSTAVAARYGHWFARVPTYQGPVTDDGEKVASLVLQEYHDDTNQTPVNVDALGAGAQCLVPLARRLGSKVNAINVGDPSRERDRSGQFRLINVKAAMWWKMREALDPQNGLNLALPPDNLVLADLTAPRYRPQGEGIMIEKKVDVKKRTGRSPDVAEALCLALWDGGGIPVQVSVVSGEAPRLTTPTPEDSAADYAELMRLLERDQAAVNADLFKATPKEKTW